MVHGNHRILLLLALAVTTRTVASASRATTFNTVNDRGSPNVRHRHQQQNLRRRLQQLKIEEERSRTACDAAYNAPCSRVMSRYLAKDTAETIIDQISAGKTDDILQDITDGQFNVESNFFPFVFDVDTSVCVAHGEQPNWIGKTLSEIFQEMGIGFSLPEALHQRFVNASTASLNIDTSTVTVSDGSSNATKWDTGNDHWVHYVWRDFLTPDQRAQSASGESVDYTNVPIKNKVAFVTSATSRYYVGVAYNHEQLPWDLPCTDKIDSWCSINNIRSVVGKAESRITEAANLEQFEEMLLDFSFNSDEYVVPGGHYLFMYRYDGPLKAHAHLSRFAGQPLEVFFKDLNREPADGAALHEALRAAAEGKGQGWVQYPWKNAPDEEEYTKVAYVVKVVFMGENYYLGSGFNFIPGEVVPVSFPKIQEESAAGDEEVGEAVDVLVPEGCPGYNLPCSHGQARQLTSHALSFMISSSLSVDDAFDVISSDPQFKIGNGLVYIWDFNGTCVAHSGNKTFVGQTYTQLAFETGYTSTKAVQIHTISRDAAEAGGGYIVYDWPTPSSPTELYQKVSYIFKLSLEDRTYYGGVDFDNVRAPLQPELDTGRRSNNDMILCSSEYGSMCSEKNSQAILGQALSDLVVASSATKARASQLTSSDITIQDVFDKITAGDELYKFNNFHVAVFSLDGTLCQSADEQPTSLGFQDDSGCCVAHGDNADYVGMTWQSILDDQSITSIRGRELHDRLTGLYDSGGQWIEYAWAQKSGGARKKIAFASRFEHDGIEYYVLTEYYNESPPPTCNACPSGTACTSPDQDFCTPIEEEIPFVKTAWFVVIMVVCVGFPCLGLLFCWCGKKSGEYQSKAHLQQMGEQMENITKQMEDEKKSANKAQKLLTSLFPHQVVGRILEQLEHDESGNFNDTDMEDQDQNGEAPEKKKLTWENNEAEDLNKVEALPITKSRPIADLFPESTISFMDIVGFTAWSSTREPTQVFELLETVYRSFDKTANRMGVFKVETVGDCYVAVCGLPDPRPDHPVVMAQFAAACLSQFRALVSSNKLSVQLGPGTSDLNLRTGLHCGPVTAGVLRGEKGRFQLFGDTVNTAARMESTGAPGRIHLSQELADALTNEGKSHWVIPREDQVVAKGKGVLSTFWLEGTAPDLYRRSVSSVSDVTSSTGSETTSDAQRSSQTVPEIDDKNKALIDWNVSIIKNALLDVAAYRKARKVDATPPHVMKQLEKRFMTEKSSLSEIKEIVSLPKFDEDVAASQAKKSSQDLSDGVTRQLREFVFTLSTMYKDNPFHNFAHATHVTMSVVKLMSRIVAPTKEVVDAQTNHDLHDYTFGITSDPITQFAVIFSALIHDVDHPGVPNAQLVKEHDRLTALYPQSAAELNSLDLAWNVLMEGRFSALRRQIYATESEFLRFRQLMVNIVLATDIMDKDLGSLRKSRWQKAFGEESGADSDEEEIVNRKATIVLEHIIQASDVAHTMQHWMVYLKWNERFFMECMAAYKAGRAEKDPSENWYKGEIGFFDFYIIPLAKKLSECGVFGVSSAEYLRYAEQNRKEWEIRGQEIVEGFIVKFNGEYGDGRRSSQLGGLM